MYFVAGGVSDGFVFDARAEPALYANLVRSSGDLNHVLATMAHEVYHVMQKTAQRRAGLARIADSSEHLLLPERLLVVTLAEGTATFAVDPTKSSATGPTMQQWRARYHRNASPARIAENFALFDDVLRQLREGSMTWDEAYERGFMGDTDARFYFVGLEMAKAIARYCGATCIRSLFVQHPVAFFRQFIALYREHSDIPGRFAPATEAIIMSWR